MRERPCGGMRRKMQRELGNMCVKLVLSAGYEKKYRSVAHDW